MTLGIILTSIITLTFAWWSDASNKMLLSHYGYDFEAMNDTERIVGVSTENLGRVKTLEISMMGIGWPLKAMITFDLELSQKLGQGKLKQIRAVSQRRQRNEEELYVYQCLTCGQKWKLEEPHDHGDGHFIKLSTFENIVTQQSANRRL